VSALLITSVFPSSTQALAGAVLNTICQFGTAVGLAVMALISSTTIENSAFANKDSPEALMQGYRASFWAAFAVTTLSCMLGGIGLRGIGKVGVKTD
jgi:hypothetical protein